MEDRIREYVKAHDYDLRGIDKYLNGRLTAASSDGKGRMTSCIVEIGMAKYHIYVIKPWEYCIDGNITIEKM